MRALSLSSSLPLPLPRSIPTRRTARATATVPERTNAAPPRRRAREKADPAALARRVAEALFGFDSPLIERIAEQLQGGKRLRARIPLAVCETLGRPDLDVATLAAATEVLHSASLVHDDLQDGDRTRRGRPAAWVRYGRGEAVLLGDAMIFLARALVGNLRVSDAMRVRIGHRFDRACASAADGQQREIELRRAPPERVTVEAWSRVARGKTAALLELPLTAAAELCGVEDGELAALARVARHYGTAFQIRDDVLDFLGEKEGRDRDADLLEGKRSILVAHAVAGLERGDGGRLLRVLDLPRSAKTGPVLDEARGVLETRGLGPALRQLEAEKRRCRAESPPRLSPLVDELLRLLDHPALERAVTRDPPRSGTDGAPKPIVTIERSVEDLDAEEWDRWPATMPFTTASWLRFAARVSEGDQDLLVARVHDHSSGHELARAVCQRIRADLGFFPSRIGSAIFAHYLRRRPLLVCRRPLFGASRCGLAHAARLAVPDLLSTLVPALEEEARRQGACALVLDGLDGNPANDPDGRFPLGFHYGEPTHVLTPVPRDFDDYLETLPRRHRADLRRKLRLGKGLGHRIRRFDRVEDLEEAWTLIEAAHARYNRWPLPPLVRRVLERSPAEHSSFHVVEEGGSAIACAAMLIDRDVGLLTHYGAADGARFAYFELFASMIREAGERGLRLLDAGTGLGDVKSRLGFLPRDRSHGRVLPLAPELRFAATILDRSRAGRLGAVAVDPGRTGPLREASTAGQERTPW